MNQEDIIELGEELQPYVGLCAEEAAADLADKGITYRIKGSNSSWTMGYESNRVNLIVNDDYIVIAANYG